MFVIERDINAVTLTLSVDELGLLNNSINEALEALDTDEFEVRVGATKEQATKLLQEFGKILGRGA